MTDAKLVRARLRSQQLARTAFEEPSEVVGWLGAVQAQDYLGGLWAVGLRTRGAVEADVEKALADARVVRTWPMRGTLHFVHARDVRWMLKLLTPRVVAASAGRYRQLELDPKVFARSAGVFVRALGGGRRLTRPAMYQALEAAKISAAGQRGLHILSRLAQDGLICFAAREGRQQTFALLDEWVPASKERPREEALAELAARYFTSHGPATLQDFVWWSGLTTAHARAGLEMARARLARDVVGGRDYWLSASARAAAGTAPRAHLLPVYDEYTVAYRDRSAVLDSSRAARAGNGIFQAPFLVGGRVAGTWRRALKKDSVVVTPSFFEPPGEPEARAVAAAARLYGRFLGLPA